jgi:hypothetical protein
MKNLSGKKWISSQISGYFENSFASADFVELDFEMTLILE